MKKEFSLIIPTRNEEKTIRGILCAISKKYKKLVEVIVVDASDDATPLIAKKLLKKLNIKGKVIRVEAKGKGLAMKKGFYAAKRKIIITVDADMEKNILSGDIEKVLEILKDKNVDIVLTRRKREDTFIRKLLGYGFRLWYFLLFGITYDTQTPIIGFRKEVLKWIDLKIRGWSWNLEFVAKAIRMGMKISNKPIIVYGKRKSGKSKINLITPLKMAIEALKIRIELL